MPHINIYRIIVCTIFSTRFNTQTPFAKKGDVQLAFVLHTITYRVHLQTIIRLKLQPADRTCYHRFGLLIYSSFGLLEFKHKLAHTHSDTWLTGIASDTTFSHYKCNGLSFTVNSTAELRCASLAICCKNVYMLSFGCGRKVHLQLFAILGF